MDKQKTAYKVVQINCKKKKTFTIYFCNSNMIKVIKKIHNNVSKF